MQREDKIYVLQTFQMKLFYNHITLHFLQGYWALKKEQKSKHVN